MKFDLDEATAVLSRTPEALKAMLNGLPRNWAENNEGLETWSPYDVVGPWQAYISILHDRKK